MKRSIEGRLARLEERDEGADQGMGFLFLISRSGETRAVFELRSKREQEAAEAEAAAHGRGLFIFALN